MSQQYPQGRPNMNSPQWNSPPQGNWQPQYGQPYPPQAYGPPPVERKTVTVQSGSTAFHVFMTIMTGGLWLLVWPFFRRKAHVTTRYR